VNVSTNGVITLEQALWRSLNQETEARNDVVNGLPASLPGVAPSHPARYREGCHVHGCLG
jgi:hypothetical protein